MSGDALKTAQYALLGAVVGSTVGAAADLAYQTVVPMVMPSNGTTSSQIDEIARMAVGVVVSTGIASLAFYGGDIVMQNLGGTEDPLQGIFFYHTLWNSMRTSMMTPHILRRWLATIGSAAMPAPAPRTTVTRPADNGPADDQTMGKPGCTSSGCGALQL